MLVIILLTSIYENVVMRLFFSYQGDSEQIDSIACEKKQQLKLLAFCNLGGLI